MLSYQNIINFVNTHGGNMLHTWCIHGGNMVATWCIHV